MLLAGKGGWLFRCFLEGGLLTALRRVVGLACSDRLLLMCPVVPPTLQSQLSHPPHVSCFPLRREPRYPRLWPWECLCEKAAWVTLPSLASLRGDISRDKCVLL